MLQLKFALSVQDSEKDDELKILTPKSILMRSQKGIMRLVVAESGFCHGGFYKMVLTTSAESCQPC